MMAAPALDTTLFALSDPHRRAVIELLKDGPQRAGELATAVELTAPAMSRHLRVLRHSGLVDTIAKNDDARVRLYALRAQPFDDLHRWLDEVRGYWTDQLDAFAAAAAKRRRKPPKSKKAER